MAGGLAEGHKDARHEGKVKSHVAFIFVAEIRPDVRWPLVRFGEEHARLVGLVKEAAHFFQHRMRFGEVLVDGSLALAQIGYGVEAEAIDADVKPEAHSPEHRLQDLRVSVIEIGL